MPPIALPEPDRLWTPRPLSQDSGFAVEADAWLREVFAPGARTLAELTDAPYLFLLGEPAMGKSTTIKKEADRLDRTLPAGEIALRIKLNEVSSDHGLDQAFDQICEWRDGAAVLHLFLDDYDECLRRYPTLKPRLIGKLERLPLDRLRLRVACRDGELPGNLTVAIRSLFLQQVPTLADFESIYRLQPLSRSAVRSIAVANDVDGDAFLAEVRHRGAESFASRPITCQELVDQFREGRFPDSQVELYRLSTKRLAGELNADRRREARLTDDGCLAIAERVAAITTVAGRDFVAIDGGAVRSITSLELGELAGGEESIDGIEVVVDRRALEEVLSGTALFAVHDAGAVRWSQQVYREFLAARYLATRLQAPVKAIEFLEHADHRLDHRAIAPQLTETAAWLAAMNEDVAAWLVEHDPAVLLRAHHHVPQRLRSKLIDWWLDQEAQGFDVGVGRALDHIRLNLVHDRLDEQLSAAIRDSGAPFGARALALFLAGVIRAVALSPIVVAIVLDSREPLGLRWRAAAALAEAGSNDDRRRVRQTLENIEGDSGDAHLLRAHTLAALWPTAISVRDAWDFLARHHVEPGDEYASNFTSRFIGQMTILGLCESLDWIAEHAGGLSDGVDHLAVNTLLAAAGKVGDDRLSQRLALAAATRVELTGQAASLYESDFWEALGGCEMADRERFAEHLVQAAWALKAPLLLLVDRMEDLHLSHGALIDRAASVDGQLGDYWHRILRRGPDSWTPDGLARVQAAAAELPPDSAGRERLTIIAAEIEEGLTAPEPPRARDAGRHAPVHLSRMEQIKNQIILAEWSPYNAWIELGRILNLRDDGNTWTLVNELKTTPGWIEASAETRAFLLNLAQRFLAELPERHPDTRFGEWVQIAAYQAGRLLLEAGPDPLHSLTGDNWAFWLPAFATRGGLQPDSTGLQALIRAGYERSPERLRTELATLLRAQPLQLLAETLIKAFDECWNEDLANVLVGVLGENIDLSAWMAILKALLLRGNQRAIDIALDSIRTNADTGRTQSAVSCVFAVGNEATLAEMISLFALDLDLARTAILSTATSVVRLQGERWGLDEKLMSNFYRVLVDAFPSDKDRKRRPGVMEEVEARDDAATLRDRMIRLLASRGTWTAVDQLRRITVELSNLALPRSLLLVAEEDALRTTWTPLIQTQEVLRVFRDQRLRIVRSNDQLLDLIVESLGRLQYELQHTGSVADLWSECGKGHQTLYRPKRELAISDYVKRFLDRDLNQFSISSNREVENIRWNEVDLLVQYVERGQDAGLVRRLATVIEVKAGWHGELLTAMRTQLADRYLTTGETNKGIYLAVWFKCERWDETDTNPRGKPRDYDLGRLTSELAEQADDLTNERRRVCAVVLDASWN